MECYKSINIIICFKFLLKSVPQ